ncbi:hypothetical protein, partial [Alicyclobacillus tolerans]
MKWILMVTFLVVLYGMTHIQVLNMTTQEIAYTRIETAMRLADHDATLDVTEASVAAGEPVFDQTAALATFEQSLAQNLDLNPTTLQPYPNTLLTEAPKILTVSYFDWSDVTAFPTTIVDTTYGVDMPVSAPSILVVVQFT